MPHTPHTHTIQRMLRHACHATLHMLCYATHATLRYACYATPRMLRYATHAMLRHACYATLRMLCYATHATLRYATLRYATLRMLCYACYARTWHRNAGMQTCCTVVKLKKAMGHGLRERSGCNMKLEVCIDISGVDLCMAV